MEELMNKNKMEISKIESNNLNRKKLSKEMENKLNQRLLEIERENYHLKEKLVGLQNRNEELDWIKNQDQEKIRLQLKEVKENYEKDKKFYQGEIEIMR